ncbi:hypothetical protein CWI38_0586p0010 [Hamiltosporidium tvaerminnensis]|uniref:Uncharacterized protein n=1 Tax=Hamiltosporidium tvaerminnensis TaxID=1176355 RepID=A0A4Q9LW90_9MICR|nr:hypothetical protein CWI38_0586p0010 [Hamiltosporidium tvaerminnensis]
MDGISTIYHKMNPIFIYESVVLFSIGIFENTKAIAFVRQRGLEFEQNSEENWRLNPHIL